MLHPSALCDYFRSFLRVLVVAEKECHKSKNFNSTTFLQKGRKRKYYSI